MDLWNICNPSLRISRACYSESNHFYVSKLSIWYPHIHVQNLLRWFLPTLIATLVTTKLNPFIKKLYVTAESKNFCRWIANILISIEDREMRAELHCSTFFKLTMKLALCKYLNYHKISRMKLEGHVKCNVLWKCHFFIIMSFWEACWCYFW